MKCLECLPESAANVLSAYYSEIREIRLRAGCPVCCDIRGVMYWVGRTSLVKTKTDAPLLTLNDISDTVQRACRQSVYAYEKQLTGGYLTLDDGARIGIAGAVNENDGGALCFKSYTSVCIRVPHIVYGCSDRIFEKIGFSGSLLVIGAPASGKTTLLRDLAVKLSDKHNVLIADERGEFSLCEGFAEKGSQCDVILWGSKSYCFSTALRVLSPDAAICDELVEEDINVVDNMMKSGVKVIAGIHGGGIYDAAAKMARYGTAFDYYAVLSKKIGKLPELYDNSYKQIIL